MNKIVAFLQNAWSPFYAGRTWPRQSWLKALGTSRSGQRLKSLEHCNLTIWYDNTTPIVGDTADSIVTPDFSHMNQVIEEQLPDALVALGSQAMWALREIGVIKPILWLPHPAYRMVTNQLYEQARDILINGFDGVIKLQQKKGSVKIQVVEADESGETL